ncbi:hypothetical protein E2C01_053250 [Portunus trituberculatus]|uniref:Uncharacterized protein n=1 Tax=Portunus trituberculatus TaxID=210409 RepID=A0A5B7GRI4_PORTR|nr:hypothetical protein [Portunus trituberculatus]
MRYTHWVAPYHLQAQQSLIPSSTATCPQPQASSDAGSRLGNGEGVINTALEQDIHSDKTLLSTRQGP